MKSIKEKAEEYSFIGQGINPSGFQYRDFNINKQEGFEAGANYVLDEIGVLLEAANKCESNSIPTWRLRYIIKQLKK